MFPGGPAHWRDEHINEGVAKAAPSLAGGERIGGAVCAGLRKSLAGKGLAGDNGEG